VIEESMRDILGHPVLLSNLRTDEIEYIAGLMETRNYHESEIIFEEGTPGNEFFIILSGSVLVRKKDNLGKEHQLTTISGGECFGEMALIDEKPRSAGVRALEETRVAVLPRLAFLVLKKENINLYCHMLENIAVEFSGRLRNMDQKYVKLMNVIF